MERVNERQRREPANEKKKMVGCCASQDPCRKNSRPKDAFFSFALSCFSHRVHSVFRLIDSFPLRRVAERPFSRKCGRCGPRQRSDKQTEAEQRPSCSLASHPSGFLFSHHFPRLSFLSVCAVGAGVCAGIGASTRAGARGESTRAFIQRLPLCLLCPLRLSLSLSLFLSPRPSLSLRTAIAMCPHRSSSCLVLTVG